MPGENGDLDVGWEVKNLCPSQSKTTTRKEKKETRKETLGVCGLYNADR